MLLMIFVVALSGELPPIGRTRNHTDQLAEPRKVNIKNLIELPTKKLEKMLRRYEKMMNVEDRGRLAVRTEHLCQEYEFVQQLIGIEHLSEELMKIREDYLKHYCRLEQALKKANRSIRRISAELARRQLGT